MVKETINHYTNKLHIIGERYGFYDFNNGYISTICMLLNTIINQKDRYIQKPKEWHAIIIDTTTNEEVFNKQTFHLAPIKDLVEFIIKVERTHKIGLLQYK